MFTHIKKHLLSLISLLVALSALSYNTWRNEQTEHNRNIRHAGFEMLLHIGEIQRIIYLAHYEKDKKGGNHHSGWVEILVIRDLSQLMPRNVILSADKLYDSWDENWKLLASSSERGVADIDHNINLLRKTILDNMKQLE